MKTRAIPPITHRPPPPWADPNPEKHNPNTPNPPSPPDAPGLAYNYENRGNVEKISCTLACFLERDELLRPFHCYMSKSAEEETKDPGLLVEGRHG